MSTVAKVIGHENSSMGDYDALVSTYCPNCFIRVVGFKYPDDPRSNVIYVASFSNHLSTHQQSWHWRLKRAWRIFRGQLDPEYEFMSRVEVDNLITALAQARDVIYPGEAEINTN